MGNAAIMDPLPTLQYPFLGADNDIAHLLYNKDWSLHILGSPFTWPQNLRNEINIILKSKIPFVLVCRIRQVLINFLFNTIKYSTYSKTINVNKQNASDEISISLEDKSIGINKADHEKIFERFYRATARRNEKGYPGFGIGLFISAEIIQRYKGKIAVMSEPGKGSKFYFSLPLNSDI